MTRTPHPQLRPLPWRLAHVVIDRRSIHLGKYDSEASHSKYRQLIATWSAGQPIEEIPSPTRPLVWPRFWRATGSTPRRTMATYCVAATGTSCRRSRPSGSCMPTCQPTSSRTHKYKCADFVSPESVLVPPFLRGFGERGHNQRPAVGWSTRLRRCDGPPCRRCAAAFAHDSPDMGRVSLSALRQSVRHCQAAGKALDTESVAPHLGLDTKGNGYVAGNVGARGRGLGSTCRGNDRRRRRRRVCPRGDGFVA